MNQLFKVILIIIFTYPAYSASISVNSSCINATSYNFDAYSYNPDFKIVFSSYVINPDYKFKELTSKVGADVVFEDNSIADISICKSYKGKTIAISDYGYKADVTVQIIRYGSDEHISIYNNSLLTIQEAISILVMPTLSLLDTKLGVEKSNI